jgi:hypothetical protein
MRRLLAVIGAIYCSIPPPLMIDVGMSLEEEEETFRGLASAVSYTEGRECWSDDDGHETTAEPTTQCYPQRILRMHPARSMSSDLLEVFPSKWKGDGVGRVHDTLSEELLMVSYLRQHGPSYSPDLLAEIQRLIPVTDWDLHRVDSRVRQIKDTVVVPDWFHYLCFEHHKRGLPVDSTLVNLLLAKIPEGHRRLNEYDIQARRATEWIRNCVANTLSNTASPPPCMQVQLKGTADGKECVGWALTAPQIDTYLNDLELNEQARLSLIGIDFEDEEQTDTAKKSRKRSSRPSGSTNKRKPAVTRSVKWHLLQNLLLFSRQSDSELLEKMNVALASSNSQLTMDQLQAMKYEILLPTTLPIWIHDALEQIEGTADVVFDEFISRSTSIVLPRSFNRDISNIWYKYCIEPLRVHRLSEKGWRPCLSDNGVYRLTRKGIVAYLKDLIALEETAAV